MFYLNKLLLSHYHLHFIFIFGILKFHLLCTCVRSCHREHAWEPQDTLFMSALSFHCMGPGMSTEIARCGGKCPPTKLCCYLQFCWKNKDIRKGSIFPKVTEWTDLELFHKSHEGQPSLRFTPPIDISPCFHSVSGQVTLFISSTISRFLARNAYDGHAAPLFFEISSAKECLIIHSKGSLLA